MSLGNWLMLLVLSLLWGGSFFFVGVAVSGLPPLSIVLLRVAIAALVLWGVVLVLRVPLPASRSAWMALLAMGVLNNVVPFSLIVWGQTHIESGLASILNATTPLFGVVLAGLLLSDERLTRLKVTGVLIGFVGTVWMIGPGALKGLGMDTLAQLARRGHLLRLCKCLWSSPQTHGGQPGHGRSRAGHDVNGNPAAAGSVCGSTVDSRCAFRLCLVVHIGAGCLLDSAGLYPVFQNSGIGRCVQFVAGDLPGTCVGCAAWVFIPSRTAGNAAFYWHGADWPGVVCH